MYTPNFKDPRVKAKCERVAKAAAQIILLPGAETCMYDVEFRRLTGNPYVNPRDLFYTSLFERFGSYKHGKHSYSFRTSLEKLTDFCEIAGLPPGISQLKSVMDERGQSFVSPPGPRSTYRTFTKNRYYDWWTNLKSSIRRTLFLNEHESMYEYDLNSAKPTLLLAAYDAWVRAGNLDVDSRLWSPRVSREANLETWRELVEDKHAVRQRLAQEIGVDVSEAKEIAQRILNSSTPSLHQDNGFVQAFGFKVTAAIQESQTAKALRRDFVFFRDHFLMSVARGDGVKKLRAGQACSYLYGPLELKAMDLIEPKLTKPAWFIHDGFFTNFELDLDELNELLAPLTNQKKSLSLESFHRTPTPYCRPGGSHENTEENPNQHSKAAQGYLAAH